MGTIRKLRVALLIEKDRTKLLSGFPEVEVGSPFFGCDDNVDIVWKSVLVVAKKFTNKPLDSVPLHGVSGSFTRRDSQPVSAQHASGRQDDKVF